jgi:hypothetical protein
MFRTFLVGAAALCLISQPLAAQSCLGLPSGNRVNMRVGLGRDVGDPQGTARVGVLVKQGFAGVSAGMSNGSGYRAASSRTVGADVGYGIALNHRRTLFLCPTLGMSELRGRFPGLPTIEGAESFYPALEISYRVVNAALSLGGTLAMTPAIDLVPTLSVGVIRRDPYAYEFAPPSTASLDLDASQTTRAVLGIGLGVQLHRRYTFSLSVRQALGVNYQSESNFMLGAVVGFGKR